MMMREGFERIAELKTAGHSETAAPFTFLLSDDILSSGETTGRR
jgi:hypothetical protein